MITVHSSELPVLTKPWSLQADAAVLQALWTLQALAPAGVIGVRGSGERADGEGGSSSREHGRRRADATGISLHPAYASCRPPDQSREVTLW
jgi:hypothetical protein